MAFGLPPHFLGMERRADNSTAESDAPSESAPTHFSFIDFLVSPDPVAFWLFLILVAALVLGTLTPVSQTRLGSPRQKAQEQKLKLSTMLAWIAYLIVLIPAELLLFCWCAAEFWAGISGIWLMTTPNLIAGLAKILGIGGILLFGVVMTVIILGTLYATCKDIWIFGSSLVRYRRRQAPQQSRAEEEDEEEEMTDLESGKSQGTEVNEHSPSWPLPNR